MPVLQSEWQALYDQGGEETDDLAGMEASEGEQISLGDSDGFLTVLSGSSRKKQRRDAAQDGQGQEVVEEEGPLPPPPASGDVMDRVDPGALCQHIPGRVPIEQFQGMMNDLTNTMIQAVAGKAHERVLVDEAARRAFVQRFTQLG